MDGWIQRSSMMKWSARLRITESRPALRAKFAFDRTVLFMVLRTSPEFRRNVGHQARIQRIYDERLRCGELTSPSGTATTKQKTLRAKTTFISVGSGA